MRNGVEMQNSQFFVYIVESPNPGDFFDDRSEGRLIAEALTLAGIPAELRIVIDDENFLKALHVGFFSAIKKHDKARPILHISAHGNEEGFSLSNGSRYPWKLFGASLTKLNRAMKGNLLLCMSCCKGYSVSDLAKWVDSNDQPFAAVVGSDGEPTWTETLLGFQVFYHQLTCDKTLQDACEAMKFATGHFDWRANTPKGIKADEIRIMTMILEAVWSLDDIKNPPSAS